MKNFIITTDSTVDLPLEYLEENGNVVLSLSYILDGATYVDMHGLSSEGFYNKVRGGSLPTTSQVNPDQAIEAFGKILKEGNDILHIGFSSGLSGSYNSACIAAEELCEEHKECTIKVIDSLCASMGQGLLLYRANEMKRQGKTLDEVAAWVEENKLHVCHEFTVDDLNHLHRGGRISKATAVLGSMVNIKPILNVDETGHLINTGKVRGRKKSLMELVNLMSEKSKGYTNDIIMISHGDCLEDALFVKEHIEEQFGVKQFMINPIGAVIGAHSGPGTVALIFMGNRFLA